MSPTEMLTKANRCDEHANAIDAKAKLEWRSWVLDRLWLESNRNRASARRLRCKAMEQMS